MVRRRHELYYLRVPVVLVVIVGHGRLKCRLLPWQFVHALEHLFGSGEVFDKAVVVLLKLALVPVRAFNMQVVWISANLLFGQFYVFLRVVGLLLILEQRLVLV